MRGVISPIAPCDSLAGAKLSTTAAPAVRSPRRGRRSSFARNRRWTSWQARASQFNQQQSTEDTTSVNIVSPEVPRESLPPCDDPIPGQSGEDSSFNCCRLLGFNVLVFNIRSINAREKRALLSAQLERFEPEILALTETWLDASVPALQIPNYVCVSRRDKPDSKVGKLNHGGIAVYSRVGSILVTHLEDSKTAERSWHTIHTDLGGILFAVWYRPPGSDHGHISSFDGELERLAVGMAGSLVVGDLNIWHKKWLKHSPANTLEGERLHIICKDHSLKQLVTEPTRGPNLLDLVLSSLGAAASASVVPAIADHKGVLVNVRLSIPKVHTIERSVWDYKKADWDGLNSALRNLDFTVTGGADVDSTVASFVELVLKEAKQYIPTRTVKEFKGTHPWLNDVCREAIVHKHSKEGTDGYKDASEQCTRTLRNAYGGYIDKTREELKSLPRGSKRWWSLNKILMDNAPSKSGIPSLREPGGEWVHDAREKADMFAHTFSAKFVLPVAVEEEPVEDEEPSSHMSNFVVIRERWVLQELGRLREDQATGIDGLPAKILRMCCRSLARYVTALIRMMLRGGRWPAVWKLHRVCPLYKKGVVYLPSNYRGLHLTPVLSKVAERAIKIPLGNYLEAIDGFGGSQWAFRKKRGCTDLVLLLVCSWLLAFQRRRKIGVFLSDISGAFDRVKTTKLLAKMRRLGICETLMAFFEDYLAPREAHVAVDGAQSFVFVLLNMIFQGTVFGPCLWNIFFADVHGPAEQNGAKERRFADDLSCSKEFAGTVANEDVLTDMRRSQADIHAWGRRNQVAFDPLKEEFAILAASGGEAQSFRLLGPVLDEKLLMHECIEKLYRKAKPKARALLRCRRFYSVKDMLVLFKAHVRSQIEWCNGAIFHAAPSLLERLDSVQTSFLRQLDLDERQAFLDHNLAPFKLRRDIGMLGVFYKICHGAAHPDFMELFPRLPVSVTHGHDTRAMRRRHDLQLVDRCDGTQLCQFQRSLFGLVKVWNALPSAFVHAESVSAFQAKLNKASKYACSAGGVGWQNMYATAALPFSLLIKYCFD